MRNFEFSIRIATQEYRVISALLFGADKNDGSFRKFVEFHLERCNKLLQELESDLDCAYRNPLFKRPDEDIKQTKETVLQHNNLPASNG
jgi:hypothetical protein